MCGIAGFFLPDRVIDPARAASMVRNMSDCLAHRGPDSADIKVITGSSSLVALGHRRLAVVDLSAAGHQPMVSHDGRYTIVYNGETYDNSAIRQALLTEGHHFRGHSDTEIILEYIARWGVERAVPLLEGMFVFALWDEREKTLTLARDRAGIKPLYWMNHKSTFAFASEMKAFYSLFEGGKPSISKQAQLLYAHNGYIPAPYTIYENVYKLMPGHILTIKAGMPEPTIRSYWQWQETADQISHTNLTDYAHDVLSDSVRITLDADVPVGCFLSGGIDSSLVTALMQSHVTQRVKTFAIGFEQKTFNEAPFAKAVAQHLGTDHTELIVSEADMLNVVPMLTDMYDEPFADSSQIPTYLVSKLAREKVTVSLSGDGGDELFSGYGRYPTALKAASIARYLPQSIRQLLRKNVSSMRPVVGGPSRISSYMRLLSAPEFTTFYNNFLTYDTPLKPEDDRHIQSLMMTRMPVVPLGASFDQKIRAMRQIDFQQYMVDDVLTKVDRASMKVSLESRVPLLNNRVIDMACRLPINSLTDGKTGKLILRDVLARYVPRSLFERPKMGFGVPMASWIRGPLKDMIAAHIDFALSDDAPFDPVRTRKAFQEHLEGRHDHSYILWLIATYGGWRARQDK